MFEIARLCEFDSFGLSNILKCKAYYSRPEFSFQDIRFDLESMACLATHMRQLKALIEDTAI